MRRSTRRCAIFHATERPRTMPAPAVGNAFPAGDAVSPSCIAIFSYAALFRFDDGRSRCYDQTAGWSSLVARWAHNPKVGGSNPPPATNGIIKLGEPKFRLPFLRVRVVCAFYWMAARLGIAT